MTDLEYILSGYDNHELLQDLATMTLIREAELLIASEAGKRTFGTPIHLAIGQEAIATGVSKWLRKTDSIFGNHRSHAHFLATGASLQGLFSEILGRKSGVSGGKGGSMHLTSPGTGLIGTMPIVGGTIPIALGAALSKRRPGNTDISVIYFGDGAAEEGVFHEALNLARMLLLPILFVCENNIFSSHLHIEERQPVFNINRFAKGHDIESFSVDGNSLSEVSKVAELAIGKCRKERKPLMIEAHTYRLYGHVGYQRDENVGLYRSTELLDWDLKDPIPREAHRIQEDGSIKFSEIEGLTTKIKDFVNLTWQKSLQDEFPADSELLSNVYFEEIR